MRDKSIRLITTFLVLLFLSSIFNFSTTDIRKNENFQINIKENQPKTSKFWNLTGSPIFIDDNDPSKNWSYTASHYDWCSGSGNWTNPYVIENVTINGQGLGSCIEIINSTAYFIIKNCTTYNSGTDTYDAGIFLDKTDNGIILDSNCSNKNKFGFLLIYSSNNTLSGNIAYNNSWSGFTLSVSGNNTLVGNIANNNSQGFYVGGSNNSLEGNIANNNSQGFIVGGNNNTLLGNEMNLGGIAVSGSLSQMTSHKINNSNLLNNKPIYYYGSEIGLKPNDFLNAGQVILINCSDSLISGVNISNCYNGIYLDYGNNNTIEDCIANNNLNNGIAMANAFNNTLSKNNASFNSKNGIYFTCSNITIWNNTANHNQEYGISAYGDNNFFIENEVNNNNQIGIKIEGHSNMFLDNRAFNNYLAGISMMGMHNNATRNTMKNCGIYVTGPLSWRIMSFVDPSNTVNEKPVYLYNNEIGLKPYNFSNAGQVQLNNCSNSVISNLNISNLDLGIFLFICDNNTISRNNFSNNEFFGIMLSGNNNTLSGNIMNNNKDSGLYLYGSNNQLIGNTMCSNNRNGISPLMSNCDFNLFLENNISNNGEFGISFSPSCIDNLLYRNIFYGNGINAEDRGVIGGNNKWDNGIIGNYWGDYTGTDSNNDGIGDTPYNIFGTANSQDNFPILDITIPNITINKPINEEEYGLHAPEFNVEIKDPHLDKMWYTINNGVIKIFFTVNGTINQALWNTAPEGNLIIRFYVNDSVGNVNFQEITVSKDVSTPTIIVHLPFGDDVVGINAPDYVIEIIELDVDTMWYTIDNGITNYTFTENGTISQLAWDDLPEGNVVIKFYANNSIGNIGFAEVTIRKDINAPIITINNPQNNDVIGATAPSFNISINEPNLDTVWYSLNGGTNITFTGLTGTINQALWDALPKGNVTIRFYANDSAGNIGFQEVTIVKEITQTSPLVIPGYDLLFLLGIMSAVAIIIIKKRLNHLE